MTSIVFPPNPVLGQEYDAPGGDRWVYNGEMWRRSAAYIGAPGQTGPEGPIGPIGATGPSGPEGAQGQAGIQGAQGLQGPTGATGSQGPQGTTGATGATGPQGLTGATGPQGETGQDGSGVVIQGTDTWTNISAIPAPAAGDMWVLSAPDAGAPLNPQGGAAAAGDGLTWDSAQWTNVGPIRGPQGLQGPIGAQGTQGATGPQGDVGTQGIQGDAGVDGAQGAAGDPGATGPTGATGSEGPQGSTGPQGVQGIQGPEGPAGTSVHSELTGKNDPNQHSVASITNLQTELDARVKSDPATGNETQIDRMVKITQAGYDAITPDAATLYVIVG